MLSCENFLYQLITKCIYIHMKLEIASALFYYSKRVFYWFQAWNCQTFLFQIYDIILNDRPNSAPKGLRMHSFFTRNLIGKLLDWVILLSCDKALSSNDSQFGFKPKHSTSQCTFVVKETVQYYLNGGSIVYGMLLDASKAFDRAQFIKLFRLLLSVICRLIATLY